MTEKEPMQQRKLDHLHIVRERPVEPGPSSFDRFALPYRALPEIDLGAIDTTTTFLGKQLAFPFLISSMTGGPQKAGHINRNLAVAAEEAKVALGLGSMRVIARDPSAAASFQVRDLCPSIPLLANLGLVQLNEGWGAEEINGLIDAVQADGIFLHVNPLQEAIQPEGDTNFAGLVKRLSEVLPHVKAPVIVKEVGAGIDPVSASMLVEAGVTWIDVAGTGGTSWAWVEGYRREDRLGHLFRGVGISTAAALIGARDLPGVQLIGSGGVRSGLDAAKALMLGASLAGSAKPFLEPALEGPAAVASLLKAYHEEFRTAMFCVGAPNLAALRATAVVGDKA